MIKQTLHIPVVCASKYHRFVWFCVEILHVCLAEKAIMDSGFKGMSCSMPVNPFKPGNLFTGYQCLIHLQTCQ